MTIMQPRMSRRSILSTLAVGVPAMGVLGAINLAGARPASAAPSGWDFLQTAESKVGCPYIWGDAGPSSFDCSGLVMWSLSQLGISFPRTSGEQYNSCYPIDYNQGLMTPGAIMYMPGHIGLSCGDGGTFFEARSEEVGVGYFNSDPGWTSAGLVPGLDYGGGPSDGGGGGGGTNSDGSLTVDGYWGSATTSKLQEILGVTADGVVSSQAQSWKASNPGLASGWEWVSDSAATGSEVIRAVQGRVGVDADGLIGPNTIKAIQGHFGTTQDGCFSDQSSCIMALQKALNSGTF